jgi:hypothetical protein
VITAEAVAATQAATQLIRYAHEPTHTMPAVARTRTRVSGPTRPARSGAGRAVVAVIVLTLALLAAVIAAGSLMT